MKAIHIKRRKFLKRSILAAGAAAFPLEFASAATLVRRLDWQTFKTSAHYSAFLQALGSMQANPNEADPSSWAYWVNVHLNFCPHSLPYFMAWHRGYLSLFERQLRIVSGDSQLVLPYWDYYTDPNIPAEFTDASPGNPLWASRVNTNVRGALTMAPFSSTITNFQRGLPRAFEPTFEGAPHDPVHDIIGSWMTTLESPVDPIFWLHHANVDRMWVAWFAAGGGRTMPSRTSSYWSGSFSYSNTMTMRRNLTYDTRTSLGYYYQRETMPTRLPQLGTGPAIELGQPSADQAVVAPAVGTFVPSAPRATGPATWSAGGARDVALDEKSVSAQLAVPPDYAQAVADIAAGNSASAPGSALRFNAVHLVLDNVSVSHSGRDGGFYYKVYLNIPGTRSVQVDTLGPFKIAAAQHHHGGPAQLRFAVGQLLSGLSRAQLGTLTVSLVRVSGDNSPAGPVIAIGEVRLELAAG